MIGAGILGVSCAIHLQRMGRQVVLIDREGPAAGASFGNAGILARSAVVPVATPGILAHAPAMLFGSDGPLFMKWAYLPKLLPWLIPYLRSSRREKVEYIAQNLAPLLVDSVDEHQRLAAGTPASHWIRLSDYLYVYRDRQAFEANSFGWSLRRNAGFDWEVLEGDAVRDLEPALAPEYRCAVLLREHAFIANPSAYVEDLAAAFSAAGGDIVRAEVRHVDAGDDGVTLQTGDEPLRAADVVIATGPWSGRLAAEHGASVPLESERGYHIELSEPSVRPSLPLMDAARKMVVTPMDAGLRLAGVVEFGGLHAGPSKAPAELLLRGGRALLPGLEFSARSDWMGHRPAPSDSLPILGRSPIHSKVFFAYGHHHVGLTAGAKSGRLIAQLMTGAKPDVDLSAYRADRAA